MMQGAQAASIVRTVVAALLENGARRATKFLSETETVVAARQVYNGKISKRDRRVTVVVSFGRPNYAERLFIKRCRKAGEPFPVKKVQLKFPKKK